jgi:glycosyltransferase involved in cell wall biosynthesis
VRIVAVAHYGLPQNRGGSELMLHELLAALARAGHTAELIVTEQDGPTVDLDGVLVHQGAEHLDRLRTDAYDVGIGHHKETGRILDWAHRTRRPVVQVVHNTNRLTAWFLARRSALVVYNTHWLHRAHGRRTRALVVHPPVWGEQHRTVRGDMITLVNPIPAKGAATFYALAERMPDLRFLAVEGGYQRDEQIRRPDLPNVVWQPHTADMRADVWARTRLLLMPSDYESWCMVGVEAMHSGIPVIAHPTPGLRESLAGAGTFLDRDDVDAWEQAIRRLYEDVPASERVRERAVELDPRPELDAFVRAVEGLA